MLTRNNPFFDMKKRIEDALKELEISVKAGEGEMNLYGAGKKTKAFSVSRLFLDFSVRVKGSSFSHDYFRIFARDCLLSAILLKDKEFLHNILKFCFLTQGKCYDKVSGEEQGKIFHEIPPVLLRGKSTKYSASDSTALFLIALQEYAEKMHDLSFLKSHASKIKEAVAYIKRHMKERIFWENPKFCGAKRFALKTTYWRDGGVPKRKDNEPEWPAAYSLLQAQTAAGLRAAAKISEKIKLKFEKRKLLFLAEKSASAIFKKFWDEKRNIPSICIDKKGKISVLTTDCLHMLYYLEKQDVPKEKLEAIRRKAMQLEAEFGYLTSICKAGQWPWHAIWPYENAFIALAAEKHGLSHEKEVAERVLRMAETRYPFAEYFYYDKKTKKVMPGGCNVQLWSVAAMKALSK